MVTVEEFDVAVKQVIHDQVNNPELDGMGKLLIPLTGVIFAKDVKKILFTWKLALGVWVIYLIIKSIFTRN